METFIFNIQGLTTENKKIKNILKHLRHKEKTYFLEHNHLLIYAFFQCPTSGGVENLKIGFLFRIDLHAFRCLENDLIFCGKTLLRAGYTM